MIKQFIISLINFFRIKAGLDVNDNMIKNYVSRSKENNLNDIQLDGYKIYHNFLKDELLKLKLLIQSIVEKELKDESSVIMDYGCGTGRYIEYFNEKAKVIGFDSNSNILENYTKKKVSNGEFHSLNLNNKLEFNQFIKKNKNKSDIFLLIEVIQILPRSLAKKFLKKINYLMNLDSLLVIVFPISSSFIDKYRYINFYKYSVVELEKILIDCSFKIEISQVTNMNNFNNHNYSKIKQDTKYLITARKINSIPF